MARRAKQFFDRCNVIARDHGYYLRALADGRVQVLSLPLPYWPQTSQICSSTVAAMDYLCRIVHDADFVDRYISAQNKQTALEMI